MGTTSSDAGLYPKIPRLPVSDISKDTNKKSVPGGLTGDANQDYRALTWKPAVGFRSTFALLFARGLGATSADRAGAVWVVEAVVSGVQVSVQRPESAVGDRVIVFSGLS